MLALTVRHDSRLSAAVGLVFLVVCPFLLIAGLQPVAEQAANYAYFFLAIGVLVQLEELLLERLGWLDHKVHLTPLRSAAVPGSDAPQRAGPAASPVAMVAVVLPVAAAGMVSVRNLSAADKLARMQVSYDFAAHLPARPSRPPGKIT